MKDSLKQALDNVELTYSDISDIANDLISEYTSDISVLIEKASNNIENITNDELRELMLRLSIKSYSFGDIKEKAAIKAECAEMLRKESYAKKFALKEGSIASKDNDTILEISNELVAEAIYNLVASLFKVKLEEIRRLIDTLKTILMSRLSEAKLTQGLNVGMEV